MKSETFVPTDDSPALSADPTITHSAPLHLFGLDKPQAANVKQTASVDTGAGPSCVALNSLPNGWESSRVRRVSLVLRAANGKVIPTKGHVLLHVRIGDYVTKDEFLVCERFPVSVILGAKFTDVHV